MEYPSLYSIQYLAQRCELEGDCWIWQGKLCNGYATVVFRLQGKKLYRRVHRMIYELIYGKIPQNEVIDHLCNRERCINPVHLEATTIFLNAARGGSMSGINKVKTHCKRGHEFTLDNTYVNPNNHTRHCRTCKKLYSKKGVSSGK